MDPPLSEMFYNGLEISCGMTMVKIFVALRIATKTDLLKIQTSRILEFGKQTRGKLGGLYQYMLWFLHGYFPYRIEYRKLIQEINQAGSENRNMFVVVFKM